ncbi:MAG: hypothetical protein HRU09_15875 [Oligoflexales bacterium]|nr:hypothetical protein [Oligoflexales bacterium]
MQNLKIMLIPNVIISSFVLSVPLLAYEESSLEALQTETDLLEMQCTQTLEDIQRSLGECNDVANAALSELAEQSNTLNSIENTCVKTNGKLMESTDLAADYARGPIINFFYRLFVPRKSKWWKNRKLSQRGIGHQKVGYWKMLTGRRNNKNPEPSQDQDEQMLKDIGEQLETLGEKAALMGEEINYHTEKIDQIDTDLEDNNAKIKQLNRFVRRNH